MRSIFVKCVVIALLAALLVTAIPMASWAAGGGSAAGTTGGVGRGTESGAPPAADSGRHVGTGGAGVTGGEVRERGAAPTQERGVGERRVEERGERGVVGVPVGGVTVYSLTVYNGDQAACYNACIASGQYPPDQCQYMCTQW